MTLLRRARHPLPGALLVLTLGLVSTGCTDAASPDIPGGGDDPVGVAEGINEDIGEVTLISGDSRATVPPVCVGDIPEDLTTCAGAPANLGEVELTASRTAAVQVPSNLANSGYDLTINGVVPPTVGSFVTDLTANFQVPEEIVAQPGPTIVTVEANPLQNPQTVWQFLLSDPGASQ